jgi:phenylacetate-coenzyme A ligase PaaK-like adenylate-forming protein
LLRYEIGDMASPGGEDCGCGSPLPVVGALVGRFSDYLVATSGALVYSGYIRSVLYASLWIAEYQLVQTEPDRIVIHFVRATEPDQADMAWPLSEMP